MLKYTLSILSLFMLSTTNYCFAVQHPQHQHPQAEHNWEEFVQQFTEAFQQGDIQTLERLRAERQDFGNINDLGGQFLKYGIGMSKWAQLIQDAQNNAHNHGH